MGAVRNFRVFVGLYVNPRFGIFRIVAYRPVGDGSGIFEIFVQYGRTRYRGRPRKLHFSVYGCCREVRWRQYFTRCLGNRERIGYICLVDGIQYDVGVTR